MIAKDTTTTINFYVADTDGLPATGQASNISASISINGAQATAISDTITEKGSGWYKFNHTFSTAGNVFIEFTATDCIIMPWEDEVVEVTGASANDVARAVWSDTASYPIFQGQYPKGYYQSNPPIVNVWGQTAYSGQSITYGDLMKSTAKSSELTGLSTFNAATDTVLIDSTQAATMVTATGFATPNDIPTASTIATAVWSDTATYSSTSSKGKKLTQIAFDTNDLPTKVWCADLSSFDITSTAGYQVYTALAGCATGAQITSAVSTLETYGDSNWVTATGFATPSDIPTADITAIKTKVNSLQNTDLTGIATTTDVSDAQSAIIAAMPDVSNLSTFDPATDKVTLNTTEDGTLTAIKTKVDTLQNTDISTLAKSSELTGLSTFDPANDQVLVSPFSASFIASQVWSGKEAYATPMDISDAIRTIGVSLGLLEEHGDTAWSTANISGLSTFNPATDTVLIDSTQAAGMATATGFATPANITTAQQAIIAAIPTIPTDYAKTTDIPDISGLATSANVSTAQSAIIAAIPTIPTDYAKATDIPDISGLSTFNPATDTVQLDSTQLTSLATGSEITDAKNDIITALADIDIDTSDLAKATDVAVIADMIKQVDAGVLHWSTTATVLTLYKEDNTILRRYSLQRDTQGNITRIDPING